MLEIPLKRVDDRVVIESRLSGQGPFGLVLDTGGAINLLDRDIARSLRSQRVGRAKLKVGRSLRSLDFVNVENVRIGQAISLDDMQFALIRDFDFGPGLHGSLSAALLTMNNSILDIGRGTLSIHSQQLPITTREWHVSRDAIRQVSNIGGAPHLFIDATINDIAFSATLDTGAPTPLRLSDSIAQAAGVDWRSQSWTPLWKDGNRIVPLVRSPSPVRLGGVTFAAPLMAIDRYASLGLPGDATAGLPLIQEMEVASSVEKGTILSKRTAISKEATDRSFSYNRSGIWIDRVGRKLIVAAVGKNSPAEASGLSVGDEIEGADFGDLIAWFRSPAGSARSLQIVTKGRSRTVRLELSDYL